MRPRPSRAVALTIAVAALVPPAVAAQDGGNPETGGAAFLLLPVGARASALGQAAMADGGSGEAVFWNPAGLARLTKSEFGTHYSRTIAANNTALTLHFVDRRLGVLGIAAYLVDYGSQDAQPARPDAPPTGRFSQKNIELLASYATDVTRALGFGISYKLIQFREDCQGDCGPRGSVVGTTHGVDAGAQLALGADALQIGVAIRHAGFKLQIENSDQADPLPTRLGVGIAYRLPWSVLTASTPVGARILVDFQDEWGEYRSPDARFGLEVGFDDLVQVRAGYAFLQAENRGASLGVGLRLERVIVDFARVFYDSGVFEDPVHLSLRVLL